MAGLQALGYLSSFPDTSGLYYPSFEKHSEGVVGPRFGAAYPLTSKSVKDTPNTSKQPNAVSYCQATVKGIGAPLCLILFFFFSIPPAIATLYMSNEPPLSPSLEAQASGPPLQVDPAVSIQHDSWPIANTFIEGGFRYGFCILR